MKRTNAGDDADSEPTAFQKRLRKMIADESKHALIHELDDDVEMAISAMAAVDVAPVAVIMPPRATAAEQHALRSMEAEILAHMDQTSARKIIGMINRVLAGDVAGMNLGTRFRYVFDGTMYNGGFKNVLSRLATTGRFAHRFIFLPAATNDALADLIDPWVMASIPQPMHNPVSADLFRRNANGDFVSLTSVPANLHTCILVVNSGGKFIRHYELDGLYTGSQEDVKSRHHDLINRLGYPLPAVTSLYFCNRVLREAMVIRMKTMAIAASATGEILGRKLSRAMMARYKTWQHLSVGPSKDGLSHTTVYFVADDQKQFHVAVFTNAGDVLDLEPDDIEGDLYPCRLLLSEIHGAIAVEQSGANVMIRHADGTVVTVSPIEPPQ